MFPNLHLGWLYSELQQKLSVELDFRCVKVLCRFCRFLSVFSAALRPSTQVELDLRWGLWVSGVWWPGRVWNRILPRRPLQLPGPQCRVWTGRCQHSAAQHDQCNCGVGEAGKAVGGDRQLGPPFPVWLGVS